MMSSTTPGTATEAKTRGGKKAKQKQVGDNPHPLIYLVFEPDKKNMKNIRSNGQPGPLLFLSVRSKHIKEYISAGIRTSRFMYLRDGETADTPIATQVCQFSIDWEKNKAKRTILNKNLHGCVLDRSLSGYEYRADKKKEKF